MVTSGFHLWQFQESNSGAKGLVMVFFWLDLWENFIFAHIGIWTGYLWISSPALYYCAMVTFGFHLGQFHVFNSGAVGLVLVFFWLVLWQIFFFTHTRICNDDLWISSPALYHCTSMTSGFHLWTISGIQLWYRGIGGSIVLIAHMRHVLFAHVRIWTGAFWFSSSAFLEITLMPTGFCLWPFQVSNSGAEGLVVVLFWLFLWEIFFLLCTMWFKWGPLRSLVLHSNTVPQWLLVFTSDNVSCIHLWCRGIDGKVLFWLELWENLIFA